MERATQAGTACSIDGCDLDAERKGMCSRHYMRVWRTGAAVLAGTAGRVCADCGKNFHPRSNRQKYCDVRCRRGGGVCKWCGSSFRKTENTSGLYCSRSCAGNAVRLQGNKPRPCEHCGEEYQPSAATRRYCSKACFGAATRRPDMQCPVCNRVFNSRHYTNTCSRACAGVLQRRNPEGSPCRACGQHIPWRGNYNHLYCSDECRRTPIGTTRPIEKGYLQVFVGRDYEFGTQNSAGWMLQHRHVVEQQIGRPLLKHERVHHKNARRDDNRPENLELWRIKGRKDPAGVRASDYHCPGCRCSEA